MNKYVQTLLFVLALGGFASILLVGADWLTKNRIDANQEALLKSVILDANSIEYTFQEIHDVFENEIVTYDLENVRLYQSTSTNNISYEFIGNGVWGEIRGIITLDSNFKTIVEISILEQEETPGLGGVVAERDYLENFVGKEFDPVIIVSKEADSSLNNEVDSITGATRTSDAFEDILNTSYQLVKEIYQRSDLS